MAKLSTASAIVVAVAALGAAARADGLPADKLAKKNDGGYFTGLPLAAYSTDIGYGIGARVYYYWNGDRDDPRFASTPYLYRVFLQAFTSTNGLQFHWLDFDAPKVFDSPYRLRSQLIYERNINQNYFGLGDRSLAPLHFPGAPGNFSTFSAYSSAQSQVAADGTTYGKYDQYDLLHPIFIASIERLFLHDHVRAFGGVGLTYARIRNYSGQLIGATGAGGASTTAPEAPTRLATDCATPGLLVGCGGGRDDYLRLGISYDTRDYEPDPNTGVFIDASVDLGTVALGSQFDYVRAMAAARGYWSPIDGTDLVLAGRAVFQYQSAGTPFFSMDTFDFTEDPRTGLGGHRTMRGFRQDRFVGPVMALTNEEVRWTFARGTLWGQKLAFIGVPFIDIGRPFDSLSDLSLRDWQLSYGGALRIAWNLATIITIDYGFSAEDTGFYVNFNHIF